MPIYIVSVLEQSLLFVTKLYITQHTNRLGVLLSYDWLMIINTKVRWFATFVQDGSNLQHWMIVKSRPCRFLAYSIIGLISISKTVYCNLSSAGKMLWKLMARCDVRLILKYLEVNLTLPFYCHLRNLLSDTTSNCSDVICVESNLQLGGLMIELNYKHLILKCYYYTF